MIASAPSSTGRKTLADLLHDLGDVPPDRVLLEPAPGSASERDLVDLLEHEGRACELIDGTLVEKPVGTIESFLAAVLIQFLRNYTSSKKLGLVSGEQGPYRLRLGLVRLPDVAFISWSRIRTEKSFPNARKFIRPGFDEMSQGGF